MPENIHQAYQIGTSYKVTIMDYNLWNGYVEEGYETSTTPSSLLLVNLSVIFMKLSRLDILNISKSTIVRKAVLKRA